ncbi:hypothetical protein KAW18_13945 [candidate division WOR-3 bacterium]|nr:hypothetical protein [Candidatus Parcubacteria bacterium]MCK4528470.1 hypothetical protein [candidate division WOR-3 bacterium]
MKNIPKKLYLYWDRGRMSRLQTFTVESFHRLNPDWKIYVYIPLQRYNENAKYIPNYFGKDYFYLIEEMDFVNIITVDLNEYNINIKLHNILRSDILRYHLLYNYGGIWSDFDVVWIKPMTYINNINYIGTTAISNINSVVSFRNDVNGYHSIGIMIHCKHDNYILSLIKQTQLIKFPYQHQSFGSTMINSMYPTFDSLNRFDNLIGVKYETYYPYSLENIGALYNKNDLSYINNNVICVHWFNGHKLSKEYVNNSGFNKNCSMTTILKYGEYI